MIQSTLFAAICSDLWIYHSITLNTSDTCLCILLSCLLMLGHVPVEGFFRIINGSRLFFASGQFRQFNRFLLPLYICQTQMRRSNSSMGPATTSMIRHLHPTFWNVSWSSILWPRLFRDRLAKARIGTPRIMSERLGRNTMLSMCVAWSALPPFIGVLTATSCCWDKIFVISFLVVAPLSTRGVLDTWVSWVANTIVRRRNMPLCRCLLMRKLLWPPFDRSLVVINHNHNNNDNTK